MISRKNFKIGELMEIDNNMTFDDYYKLKLSTKKLNSGKCQVKFYATLLNKKDMYGYVLVDANQTLKDVVVKIKEKLTTIRLNRDFHHIHLYSVGKRVQDDMNFIIFDS